MSYVFMKVLEGSPERYDFGIKILSLGRINKIMLDMADSVISGDRVLEIGCGTGTLAGMCGEKGGMITCIDLSDKMLSIARRKIEPVKERVDLRQLSAMEMDTEFDGQSFDIVLSSLVFSELEDDELKFVIHQCCRILKKGGYLVVVDEVEPDNLIPRVFYRGLRLPMAISTYILTQRLTRPIKDFKNKIKESGLNIVEVKNYGFRTQLIKAQKSG